MNNEDEKISRILKLALARMNEKDRRRFLADVAKDFGRGGVTQISNLSGVARSTIITGMRENYAGTDQDDELRVRRHGGGRMSKTSKNPDIPAIIDSITDEDVLLSDMKVLTWKTLSLREFEKILKSKFNMDVGYSLVKTILISLGYDRHQFLKNPQQNIPVPDGKEQFAFIDNKAYLFLRESEPVISVETKKKEIGEEFKKDDKPQTSELAFVLSELGEISKYEYLGYNESIGFLKLGEFDDEISDFVAESVYRWWLSLGKLTFPGAHKLYIVIDVEGVISGLSKKTWKSDFQTLSDRTGLEIDVSHYPAGVSRWVKKVHRMYFYKTEIQHGNLLTEIESTIDLISLSTPTKDLKVQCMNDETEHTPLREIKGNDSNSVNIKSCDNFGMWNYMFIPRKRTRNK
ncbi:MAG: ISAzo13 family transposase [Clostridia bacterium]|nr:ISAzo13 family transposase [Clostridia bacterium]